MKIKKFLQDIKNFFKSDKIKKDNLKKVLTKLENKKKKFQRKIENHEFEGENIENIHNKIIMIEEFIQKAKKQIKKR